MTMQMELWQLILLLLAFFGFSTGAGKLLLAAVQKHLETNHIQLAERLERMETTNQQEASNWQRVERDFLRFQADMPLHYVRREDYIRGQSVIEAKLDGLGSKLEAAQLRAITGGYPHAN
jgi:hypothetical protein